MSCLIRTNYYVYATLLKTFVDNITSSRQLVGFRFGKQNFSK